MVLSDEIITCAAHRSEYDFRSLSNGAMAGIAFSLRDNAMAVWAVEYNPEDHEPETKTRIMDLKFVADRWLMRYIYASEFVEMNQVTKIIINR